MDEETSKPEEMSSDIWDGCTIRLDEDLSPPTSEYAHGRLPNIYPTLPNFGILYLSVRGAAELVVRDMHARNRPPFDRLITGILGYAEKLAEVQLELTSKLRERLVRAIEKGNLHATHPTNSFEDFIELGDEAKTASSLIHYRDLVEWLVHSGYEDSRFLAVGPAFEVYEQQELNLGEDVELYIQKRRERSLTDAIDHEDQGTSQGDAYTECQSELIMRYADVITELKQKLGLAPIVNDGGPLVQKERDSLLAIVAVLLTKWSGDIDDDPTLVGRIVLAMRKEPRHIGEGAVRKFLKQARAPYVKSEKKLVSSKKAQMSS